MASTRGYLTRLVDEVATRRARAAHAPRQIAWGPSRPAWQAADDEAGAEPSGRSTPAHRPARAAGPRMPQHPQPSREGHIEPPPAEPATGTGLRIVTDRPAAREAGGPATGSRAQTELSPPRPARRQQAMPATRTSADRAGQPDQPRLRVTDAPARLPAKRPPAPPAELPAAVTDALTRLTALSQQVRRDAQPVPGRLPARPRAPQPAPPAQPVRTEPRSTVPAAVFMPGRPPERPAPAARVHIAAIEVTITAPSPPPAAAVAAPAPRQPAPVAPAAPLSRLSRPGAAFGLGQG